MGPSDIAQSAIKIAKNKAALSIPKMILLGIVAGIFIALAGVASTFGNVYVGKLAGACIFPAGLAMVVVAGSELFTGNCLMIAALFSKEITLKQLLKNWSFVFLGNFIGAVLVSLIVVLSGALDTISDSVITAATTKANLNFFEAFFRGVLCNVLVCIAVWMSFGAKTASEKIIAVFFPVMLFVLCGFEHSIANMYYIPAGMMESIRLGITSEGLNIGNFLINNLLPVTIGNIIGGAGIVGGIYYLVYLKNKK